MRFLRSRRPAVAKQHARAALDVLLGAPGVMRLNESERAAMTLGCRSCDAIPKVADAGCVVDRDGTRVQVMHNGVVVEHGGYFGEWMASIISGLRGHHEPQEEAVFHSVLDRLGPRSTMIEFGSNWAYYSLWFNQAIADATVACCEPDIVNLELGRRNAALNAADLDFRHGAAGPTHNHLVEFALESDPATMYSVPTLTVDGLLAELGWERLDLLHVDVQGAELDALAGAVETIRLGLLRFVFVSTHHYLISGDPDIHSKCIRFLESAGAHIITSHTVAESYSGDGLVVASFDDNDVDFTVDCALNHTDRSLFRPHEADLAILVEAFGRT